MKFTFIAPTLPPTIDGIGDHTALLANQLAREHQVTVLVADDRACDPLQSISIVPAFNAKDPSTNWNLYQQIRSDPPDWVVLQYNPFSYGNRGFNLTLPRVIEAIKRDCPRTRVVMMGHERYTPVINLKFAIMTTWQRYEYHRIGRAADLVIIATTLWADEFRKKHPGKMVVELPVGSNLPREQADREELRRQFNIPLAATVLGIFGTAHPSRVLEYVRAAAEKLTTDGKYPVILYLGPDCDKIKSVMAGLKLVADGPLPADEISRRLRMVDIYTATIVDGVSGRRGSFFAGLQHGLATAGTSGPSTDPFLQQQNGHSFLLSPTGDIDAYVKVVSALASDPILRQTVAARSQAFFDAELSWEKLGRRFIASLGTTLP